MAQNHTKQLIAIDELRFALNELKAIGTPEERAFDRTACASRLRHLSEYLLTGGTIPNVVEIMRESLALPVQE